MLNKQHAAISLVLESSVPLEQPGTHGTRPGRESRLHPVGDGCSLSLFSSHSSWFMLLIQQDYRKDSRIHFLCPRLTVIHRTSRRHLPRID